MSFIEFDPWRPFDAYRDKQATRAFLRDYAETGVRHMRREITSGRKSGRVYRGHRASAAGEFPASLSGRLARSVTTQFNPDSASFGSTVFYAKFLADGTSKMASRAMSKEAHKAILGDVRGRMGRWVIWRLGA